MRPRRDDVRAAIRRAADEHFLTVGYRAASLERIARTAGFTKGAVYSNFSSKSTLFLAVLEARLEAFAVSVDAREQRAQSRAEAERTFAAHLAREIVAEAPWHRCVAEFSLEAAGVPDIAAEYVRLRDRRQEDIAAWVRRAGEQVVGDDPRPLATALLAAASGFALELGPRPDAIDEAAIARALRGLIAAFVRTAEPIRAGAPPSDRIAGSEEDTTGEDRP